MGKFYNHLSMDERNVIHRGKNEGLSLRAIARKLNRTASAVSRELARNTGTRSYDACRAGASALARCRRGPRKLRLNSALFARVRSLMEQGWSPEQVAGRLQRMEPENPQMHVSHETIYCALYAVLGTQSAQTPYPWDGSPWRDAQHDLDSHAPARSGGTHCARALGRGSDQGGG